MRISAELIQRCSSQHLLPMENNEDFMERITHLYLQEQHIRKIENLQSCRNLVALYLYDNKIQTIENLDYLIYLNCLYLQKNFISRIENVDTLTQLTVLNLSHNAISKLEGLEALSELRELYLQYQNLPGDQSFQFDYSTINWLSESLKILNVSGNKIKSFTPLKPLQYLEIFVAEENDVDDLQELVNTVSNWTCLHMMKLNGNPVCGVRKYRDNVVVTCLELEELDGKVVFPSYRNFLLNWKQCQTLQELKRESYAVLKPFLETQIKNKQLTPPRSARSSSVAPSSDRSGSMSSSQSEASSVSSKSRSKSAQRKQEKSSKATGCFQEVPRKLVKKITKNK